VGRSSQIVAHTLFHVLVVQQVLPACCRDHFKWFSKSGPKFRKVDQGSSLGNTLSGTVNLFKIGTKMTELWPIGP